MADSYSNFCLNEKLNPNFDITWSFQYSVTGSYNSNGGFSTFLFNNNVLEGGGMYSGLGYAPYQEQNGVSGFIIGVQFDSSNQITIKTGTNFNTLTSVPLLIEAYPLVKSFEIFNTIRFNLTNSAQLLNIAIKDENNKYITKLSVPTEIQCKDSDLYRIGFSYASPLQNRSNKINLKIKDIAIQGHTKNPTIYFNPRPPTLLQDEESFLVQSPSAEKMDISYENSSLEGSLLNK
jgi:hypothetical protein